MFRPIVFDEKACKGCNTCVEVCLMEILQANPEKGKPPTVAYPDECAYDGACWLRCPEEGQRGHQSRPAASYAGFDTQGIRFQGKGGSTYECDSGSRSGRNGCADHRRGAGGLYGSDQGERVRRKSRHSGEKQYSEQRMRRNGDRPRVGLYPSYS